MVNRKSDGNVISLGDSFRKPDVLGVRLQPALRKSLIEQGVHESRVEEYMADLTSKAVLAGNKPKPQVGDYSKPLCIADILAIDYGPTLKG